ncbi:FA32A protein, partial [Pseudoatta argentina]
MIQKQGHWVPYELKPRTTASTAEKKRFSFLHRIVTGDEKWIHYDNPKRRQSWGKPGHASTSSAKPNIHAAIRAKTQTERIKQKASKTHKQRVEEFNRHLDSLTEHFDIPKVSWTK